jgi:ubiquinone/menaquinone biosynthesis C-methylase UbiE
MADNFWNNLMGSVESAGEYMLSYGEGPGSSIRHILSEFIQVGETVLDVGCGPGHNMDHLAEYGPRVTRYKGVDYASYFIEADNQKLRSRGYDFVDKFEVQDCRDLKELNESWDVIIIQDCLEHTNGYERPMKEALRVARKRIIIAFWHLTENDDHINDDGNDGWGAWYSKPKWEEFLNSTGYAWHHIDITTGEHKRVRDFYIIDKEQS